MCTYYPSKEGLLPAPNMAWMKASGVVSLSSLRVRERTGAPPSNILELSGEKGTRIVCLREIMEGQIPVYSKHKLSDDQQPLKTGVGSKRVEFPVTRVVQGKAA